MSINKKRNSIFLYEILIREYTKAVLAQEEVKKELVLSIIKEAFKPGTQIYLEWSNYRALLGIRTNKPLATKIFNRVMDNNKLVDQEELDKEQGRLLKRINKVFKPSIFQNFVPNYKSLASIYQLFKNKNMPIKKRVMLEEQVINSISFEEEGKLSQEQEQKETYQPISKLAFKTFVEKFNQKYSMLLPEQREMLSKFALADDKMIEFKVYLNEEIGRLKSVVDGAVLLKEVKEDREMVSKVGEVKVLLESFARQEINSEMVEKLFKIQQLCKEIEGE
jgi:hypothetical protein